MLPTRAPLSPFFSSARAPRSWARHVSRALLSTSVLVSLVGCSSVVSGLDPVALGYGSATATLAGYDEDPVPRARVTGWTPPERERGAGGGGEFKAEVLGSPSEPVPFVDDVHELCRALESLGSDEPRPQCLRRYRIARLFRTMDKWKGLLGCVREATQTEASVQCERDNPLVFNLGDDYPREVSTCMHVLALSIVENAGPEPMMGTQDILEFEPIVRSCVDALVEEERDERGPKRYFEMLDCIDAGQTTDEAEACD